MLNGAEAIRAGYSQGVEEKPSKTANDLAPAPTTDLPNQYGSLTEREAEPLYAALEKIAVTYRDDFQKQFQVQKDIRLVPIAKLKEMDGESGKFVNVVDKPYSVVVGVVHKLANGLLSGIAGLLVRVEHV